MNYPKTIKNLIECFKKLPGIGEKTAERMALATLKLDDDIIEKFSESIKNIKKNTHRCKICNSYSEKEICDICSDDSRNKEIICVVEEPKNVILLEKIGTYKGTYHVLGGLISPLDGISPDKINIDNLVLRIKNNSVKEVIIAVRPTIEGETTALYLSKILSKYNVKVTKIAHGIPLGADMEYIDSLTLEIALEDRKQIIDEKQ